MNRYSISRVNTYLENPWKHWCKYIAKYKPKEGKINTVYMDRGTVMHRVMELVATGTDSKEALKQASVVDFAQESICLLYTSPSPRDGLLSRMPSSA